LRPSGWHEYLELIAIPFFCSFIVEDESGLFGEEAGAPGITTRARHRGLLNQNEMLLGREHGDWRGSNSVEQK